MTCRGCTPTGCGSSTRSTAPGSSPPGAMTGPSTSRCGSENGPDAEATAASPTPRWRCPRSARSIAPTPSPRRPPRTEGPIRITASASRPPAVLWRLADQMDIELVRIGSAGAKAMAVVRGDVDAYLHAGGQWEWDSAAPAGCCRAAGLHASRLDGSPLIYNRRDPYLPDLLMCRPELAEALLTAIRSVVRGGPRTNHLESRACSRGRAPAFRPAGTRSAAAAVRHRRPAGAAGIRG